MGNRMDLQLLFEALLGSRNVYFQPPTNIELKYPCIIYNRNHSLTQFANNRPYRRTKRYQVTYISRDPDSPVPDMIGDLPMCTFTRHFTSDNLNHDVFDLYF